MLRRWLTEVRTDLVSNIVQPGRFIAIERGLVFHIRERQPNGLLVGLMLDDRRDPKERVTILAEQGAIVKNDRGNFLVLENGSIQRHEYKQRDPNIVIFDRYAFDLSQFASNREMIVQYSVRERYLGQLIWPDPERSAVAQPAEHGSAPNFTTASWRRSIRWRSWSLPTPSSVRRAPRGKAASGRWSRSLPPCRRCA